MTHYKVKPGRLFLRRIKLDTLREIAGWQAAEPDTEEEQECEARLRHAVDRLLEWCPEYKECTMVSELDFRIKEDLKKEEHEQ